jgi:hypothetical protein
LGFLLIKNRQTPCGKEFILWHIDEKTELAGLFENLAVMLTNQGIWIDEGIKDVIFLKGPIA